MNDIKLKQHEEEIKRMNDIGENETVNHAQNSKLMTLQFPDIIKNQTGVVRRHGDTSHYAKTMEQALLR